VSACPWCAADSRKRHADWCPCSAESRRRIRAAYRISDSEGMAEADRIRVAAERPEPREGIVTAFDHEGRYVGCIGSETWEQLLARGGFGG